MSVTKFVIYHQPRTGSTLLWGLLGNHPSVLCLSELFHPGYHKHPDQFGSKQFNTCYSQHKTTKDYLGVIFSQSVLPEHKAVGFKLQGYQARDEGDLKDVRRHITENNFKIIMPFRRNKLEQFVSQSVAMKTDVWQRFTELPDGTKRDDPPVSLEKVLVTRDQFLGWYKWENMNTKRMIEESQGLDVLDVYYEDLLFDWDNQTCRMLDFLGVDHQQLLPKTKKAREQPLCEWIENYDEACFIHDSICTPEEIEWRIKKG